MNAMRVCFVIANAYALNAFLAGPIRALAREGWEVTAVVNARSAEVHDAIRLHASVVPLALVRDISPWRDLRALVSLWWLWRRHRFDVVHSATPKAGLLSMLSARVAGVRLRLHTFGGQVWATRRGPMRWLLRAMDRLNARCARRVLADSRSQARFMVAEGVVREGGVQVLGHGSICGVDGHRFRPDAALRAQVRAALGIPEQAQVIVYLGRLHLEKGLVELACAFEALAERHPQLYLLLAGPDEGAQDAVVSRVRQGRSRLRLVGLTQQPHHYLAAGDVATLPSYREGLGMALLEAQACALPCVATRICGIVDAVDEGRTALLVPPRDAQALADALEHLLTDAALRERLQAAARPFVMSRFSQAQVIEGWLALYRSLRGDAGTPQGQGLGEAVPAACDGGGGGGGRPVRARDGDVAPLRPPRAS